MPDINLPNVMQYFLYGALAVALTISCVTDILHRRIPNFVTLPTVLIALLIYSMIGGLKGFLFSLGGLSAGFLFFLLPYLLGGMGAGDVKLMAAVGAVLGFDDVVISLLFIAVSGGILATGLMLHRGIFKQTISKICAAYLLLGAQGDASLLKVDTTKLAHDGIPFAVAISSGVFLFIAYMLATDNTLFAFTVV